MTDLRHGSRYTYVHYKCRCEKCTEANRAYQRTLQGKTAPSHGASGYFNYGCRCDVCRAAGAVKNREAYERWRAKSVSR